MKVSVQVGSNKIRVLIGSETTAADLTRAALAQCKMAAKAGEYAAWERALGVERALPASHNVHSLVRSHSKSLAPKVDFVVRRSRLVAVPKAYHSSGHVFKMYRCSSEYANFHVVNNSVDVGSEHVYEACPIGVRVPLCALMEQLWQRKNILVSGVKRLRRFKKKLLSR